MNFTVVNHEIKVGRIKMLGVSTSALFLIGDANFLIMSSILNTPPESLVSGPFVPPLFSAPTA